MKSYENVVTSQTLDPNIPIYARIDGRSFSSLTRGMERPFDPRMTITMQCVLRSLVRETQARAGYTQSDEISLVWLWNGEKTEPWFGGKIFKLTSNLASMTTALFYNHMQEVFPSWECAKLQEMIPSFDCRVMNLPNETEASNMFLWRCKDAQRNAIQSFTRTHFSHKQVMNKSQNDMLRMLAYTGRDITKEPDSFRFGTWAIKYPSVYYSMNYDKLVERDAVKLFSLNRPFNEVTNRVDFIFNQCEPIFGDFHERNNSTNSAV